jgi:hypothetical protein
VELIGDGGRSVELLHLVNARDALLQEKETMALKHKEELMMQGSERMSVSGRAQRARAQLTKKRSRCGARPRFFSETDRSAPRERVRGCAGGGGGGA